MADFDEEALIERCRTGDDIAFGELVERYKHLVYGMVWRLTSDRSRAEDLAQEVFLKIYRGLPYFRGEARLSTWIFRIVTNVCAQDRSSRPPEPSSESVREPGRHDSAFADLELRDRLIAAHYLEGVQYEALAEALDIPLGTVKTHLYRAKRLLRELLR
jgi:RNA polymerase sigma-70 factor, ECF subfamily